MGNYVLFMFCAYGDQIQVAIKERGDIVKWLKRLDHGGSNWEVIQHRWNDMRNDILGYDDITAEIADEYKGVKEHHAEPS